MHIVVLSRRADALLGTVAENMLHDVSIVRELGTACVPPARWPFSEVPDSVSLPNG
jgi:hypothetical protein